MGYGKTRGEVLKIVEVTMRKKGRELVAQYLKDGGTAFGKGGLNLVSERAMRFLLHVKNYL